MSDSKSSSKKGKKPGKSPAPVTQPEEKRDSLPLANEDSTHSSGGIGTPTEASATSQLCDRESAPSSSLSQDSIRQIATQVAQIFGQQGMFATPLPFYQPGDSVAAGSTHVAVSGPPSCASTCQAHPTVRPGSSRKFPTVDAPVPHKRRRIIEIEADSSDNFDSDASEISDVPSSLPITITTMNEPDQDESPSVYADVPDYHTGVPGWNMTTETAEWFMKRADRPLPQAVIQQLQQKYSVSDQFEPFFRAQELPSSVRNLIKSNHHKYLCFQWIDQRYQYVCLPFGLTSAPRIFTKVMKIPIAHARSQGILCSSFIDESSTQLSTETIVRQAQTSC
ncbi:uncharacterized protein [Ptychodera flava]|uniref:uncharacterized protein n=1 Tax=Ptychodera flava TaxID=63121 RepID=UPI00396AAACA